VLVAIVGAAGGNGEASDGNHGKKRPTRASLRRQVLASKVNEEIDQLVAHFHAILPRNLAQSLGAIYARYSTRFQDSVIDQIKALFAWAVANGVFVAREDIYFDLGERGAKERRAGLQRLRQGLEGGHFKVLLVFSTNRLYRKAYKTLKLIEEEIVERGLRCVFVSQRIDTGEKDRWRLPLQLQVSMDEQYGSANAENIRAAHLGLASSALVFCTIAFGYCGIPIEGQYTRRKTPRCRLAIDKAAAEYVQLIYHWFVNELLDIVEIVRRLNADPNAPPPPKSLDGCWTRQSVLGVLRNRRYCGFVPCSETETRWLSSADYARQFPRDKPLGLFHFEDLRILPDDIWLRAQVRLAEQLNSGLGRPAGKVKKESPSGLLNKFLFCPEHHTRLHVGGNDSTNFICKRCRETSPSQRTLFTMLNQELASRKVLQKVREILTADESLLGMVIAACQQAVRQSLQPDLPRLAQLQAKERKLTNSIELALRDPGDSLQDQEETKQLLRQFRQERTQVQAELGVWESMRKQKVDVPTDEQIKQELNELDVKLTAGLVHPDAEQLSMARSVIEMVTGGYIELQQMGERVRGQGWLRGTFQCNVVKLIASRVSGVAATAADDSTTVTIDFKEPAAIDEKANRAKELYDQSVLNKEIARQLGCSQSRVTLLLHHWFDSRGLEMPDGRARRSGLTVKYLEPPLYQRLMPAVMELYFKGTKLQDIAAQLSVGRHMVTNIVRNWHQAQNLPVPDGRTRRKQITAQRNGEGGAAAG
jgi:DNA invertase Pin-like site-specific DNA recombinase